MDRYIYSKRKDGTSSAQREKAEHLFKEKRRNICSKRKDGKDRDIREKRRDESPRNSKKSEGTTSHDGNEKPHFSVKNKRAP
jgi:hypothetical protein